MRHHVETANAHVYEAIFRKKRSHVKQTLRGQVMMIFVVNKRSGGFKMYEG